MSLVQGGTITGVITVAENVNVQENKNAVPSLSQQIITPDANYDALAQVTISAMTLQDKTVKSSASQQTITADSGYDGLGAVTVEAVVLQNKTVTPSASQQTVTADTGYDALSQVVVEGVQNDGFDFVLSNDVSNIPNYFFRNQTQMKSFTWLKSGAGQMIGVSAFDGCNNMTRYEQTYCSRINPDAFSGCSKMTDYYFGFADPGKNSIPTLSSSSAIQGATGYTIHVPPAMESTYKSDSNWSDLTDHIVGDYNA